MSRGRHAAAIRSVWGLVVVLWVIDAALWLQTNTDLQPLPVILALTRWAILLLVAAVATRAIERSDAALARTAEAHRATRTEYEQLQVHNAILQALARSVDVPLAFQSLAERLSRIVPCDRVGLALLADSETEFQTYTARVNERDRRERPRPEVVFKAEKTVIGAAVRSREPIIINDASKSALEYLDVNVLHTSGFASALIIPLVAERRGVGTLNLVSRARNAFSRDHVEALLPITEMLAVAHVAQELQAAATRQRTMQGVAELTVGIAAEINNALQTIVGQCNVLEHDYADQGLQRDLATIVRQAQRIAALLDRMRTASTSGLEKPSDR